MRILHDRLQLGIRVLPQVGELQVVLDSLLAIALRFADLAEPLVGRREIIDIAEDAIWPSVSDIAFVIRLGGIDLAQLRERSGDLKDVVVGPPVAFALSLEVRDRVRISPTR